MLEKHAHELADAIENYVERVFERMCYERGLAGVEAFHAVDLDHALAWELRVRGDLVEKLAEPGAHVSE